MSRRLYIGRLALDATRRDLETFFDKYGTMTDVRIMNGFGFVEFENVKDAEDAIAEKNGEPLLGENLILEPAKEARRRDDFGPPRGYGGFDDRFRGPPPSASRVPPRAGRGRVIVKGISPGMSWQDLKDFGREGGPVSFADVDRDNEGQGIIEYPSLADAEDAIKKLDGQSVRGNIVTVVLAALEEGGAPGGGGDYRRDERDYSYAYRRDDRGYDRRDDRRDYDRRGDDRDYRRDDYRRDDYRRDDRRDYDRRGDDRRDDRRGDDRRDDRDRYDDRRAPPPRDDRDDRRREPEPRRERSPAPVERRRSRSPAVGGEKPTGWE